MCRHLHHISHHRIVRNRDRLWPARRAAREAQERDFGLAFARLESRLRKRRCALGEAIFDQLVQRRRRRRVGRWLGQAVDQNDAVAWDASLLCRGEGRREEKRMYDYKRGFADLNLIDELFR